MALFKVPKFTVSDLPELSLCHLYGLERLAVPDHPLHLLSGLREPLGTFYDNVFEAVS